MGGIGLQLGTYLPRVLVALGHLVGLVVAIILVVRKKGTAAVLALVAFIVLLLLDIGAVLRMAFLDRRLAGLIDSPQGMQWAFGGLSCCCGILDLVAIICLVVALWKGMGPADTEVEEESAASE